MAKAAPVQSPERRSAGPRSNLFLTAAMQAQIERLRDAQEKMLGMRPSSAAVQHQAMNLGLAVLAERLGLPPMPAEPPHAPDATRGAHGRR